MQPKHFKRDTLTLYIVYTVYIYCIYIYRRQVTKNECLAEWHKQKNLISPQPPPPPPIKKQQESPIIFKTADSIFGISMASNLGFKLSYY